MTRRTRLRRRLLIASAPVVLVALLAAAKLISVVLAGHSAVAGFAARDSDALRGAVATMQWLNVVEPAKAPFAAGTLAVLENRLADADTQFSTALQRTPPAQQCPVLVNLELVRERQGDIDAWENRPHAARERYLRALDLVTSAPPGCFGGNDDPDEQRHAVRADAAARLMAKLDGLDDPPPPPPAAAPPPPPVAAPPPAGVAPDDPDPVERRLEPGDGDPLDRLRQVLADSAAS